MVNWSVFETLPGDVTYNFEMLCRSLVWLNYGRFGSFRARLNQPGIEFELKLHTDCELGVAACHYGWQCKWYDLLSGKDIGKSRRSQIKDALEKTLKATPDLTDWVLWTRRPLTKSDQIWFYGLSEKVRLHLWTSHEAETLLNLDGEQLKRTYFGDLILTPKQLLAQHEQSVAPIKKRWFPEVHQKVDAERYLQRMLGSPTAWDELRSLADDLMESYEEIQLRLDTVPEKLKELSLQFQSCLQNLTDQLKSVYNQLSEGNFLNLHQGISSGLKEQIKIVASFPRKARGARIQVGLIATDALADLYDALEVLEKVMDFLNTRLVGVVADAGGGKTQLSAELTTEQVNRPAGVMLLGRYLVHGSSLDSLAAKVVINGTPVPSMQALLAAVNAAAERAKCILPIVIDGLNEAEDPREWKSLLSSLEPVLKNYPSVLLICTLRSGEQKRSGRRDDHSYYYDMDDSKPKPFVDSSLPDGTFTVEIPDFGDDVGDAMERYFEYFKIDAQPGLVYEHLLIHPLTLRIFCEVTNHTREKKVGMEAVPRSLAALFERYIEQAANRIEELAPRHCRYLQADIINQLDTFGRLMWTSRTRAVSELEYRSEIGDERNLWTNSAVHFMEQEGLLLRMPGKVPGRLKIIPTYDLLGGFLIAKYIISTNGRDTIGDWLNEPSVQTALGLDYSTQHPLREDIVRFLVALAPQYHRIQLWQVSAPSLRAEALEQTVLLEPKHLDKATLEAISEAIKASPTHRNNYLGNLMGVHDAEKHPLNAMFVDAVLLELPCAKRDLIWSEWLRRNEKSFQKDLNEAIDKWSKDLGKRDNADQLRANWMMWMLTSTSHKLRHLATLALYWYGRGAAERLYEMTIRSLAIDDPYILERMLAASYGASMALFVNTNEEGTFQEVMSAFARQLHGIFFGEGASDVTSHAMILDYARGIIELSGRNATPVFSAKELSEIHRLHPLTVKPKVKRITRKQTSAREWPLGMDFENYVLGKLAEGRHTYDFKHKGYQKIRSQVWWRICDLGWSIKDFGKTDQMIANSHNGYDRHDGNKIEKVDRYGKKYSWIAYYEQMGLKERPKGEELTEFYQDRRESDADIDPSFPDVLPSARIVDLDVLGTDDIPLQDWVRNGKIPDLDVFLQQDELEAGQGPWVLLDGYIGQQDEHRGRGMFGFIRAFFVSKEQESELIKELQKQRLGGRWLPEKAECRGAFAGEVPWSSHFDAKGQKTLRFVVSEKTVEIEELQEKFYLDGSVYELSFFDKLRLTSINFPKSNGKGRELSDEEFKRMEVRKEPVIVKKVMQEFLDIPVLQPVCDLRTPGKTLHEHFTGGITLVNELSDLLALKIIPQSRDLMNASGKRVTFQNSYQNKSYKNSERLFFLKKDLLDSLLEKLGMSLVWAVWGERELSLGQIKHWDRNNPDGNLAYADFQQVHVYSAGEMNDQNISEDTKKTT